MDRDSFFIAGPHPRPRPHPQGQYRMCINWRRAGWTLSLHLVREGEEGRQEDPRQIWSLAPIWTPLAPGPSLRWAMGFSLREGNSFWPETTEPLSHFRLASPLPTHCSYTRTWGLEGWSGESSGSPPLRAGCPDWLASPSVLS